MATRHKDARDEQAAQRTRQFGLRDVAALVTCLAVTLALYQRAIYGVALAVLLTSVLSLLAWQATRYTTRLTSPIAFALLAAASLAVECALAWAYGFSGGHIWLAQLLLSCCALRTLFGVPALFEMLGTLIPPSRSAQADGLFRMGFTGRAAIVILWVPLLFSHPLAALGTLVLARSIGVEAIVAACQTTKSASDPSPVLTRLGMDPLALATPKADGSFVIQTSVAVYHVVRLPNNAWQIDVDTGTMQRTRVGVTKP